MCGEFFQKLSSDLQQRRTVVCVVEDDPSPRKRTCEVSTSSDLRVRVINPGLLAVAVGGFFFGGCSNIQKINIML